VTEHHATEHHVTEHLALGMSRLLLLAGSIVIAVPTLAGDVVSLQPRMGAPLAALTSAERELFDIGRSLYVTPLLPSDGLGPIFNKSNCQSCHSTPAPGGWGNIAVTHFGLSDKDAFENLEGLGGPLLQTQTIAPGCGEFVPDAANTVIVRVTNSSMAFGLIEAIPDEAIAANEDPTDLDGDGVSGRVHWVAALEDPMGSPLRAGRFGWKAQVATVLTFSADASRNEMGLTNRLLPEENAPNGDFGLLSECDPVPDPEDVADADGFEFIDRVTHFQRYLAPPPQTPRSGMSGEAVFAAVGCTACHVPEWTTANDPSLEAAIRNRTIRPYSDFLLHDMGLLADGFPEGDAGGQEMRTPVLWGLRTRDPMLHDGSAAGGTFENRVAAAIAAHGPFGEGAASAAAFEALPQAEKDQLIAFLGSLGRLEFDHNADGNVDLLDFTAFEACYGSKGTITPDDPCAVSDLDQDGDVDLVDFEFFLLAYERDGGEVGDCDGDGVVDLEAILVGLGSDRDGDGVPDDCVACAGDLDGSGAVDGVDLGSLLASWGAASATADLNGDGVVNGIDLGIVLANWGACP
jgi:CxxC motif-containing protein (DUF1111 family)